jgi:hypothetical protein
MTRRKDLMLSTASGVISLAVFLILCEIVLRFLPVSTGLRSVPVTAADPIFHFTANRSFVHSFGWNLELPNLGRVNNAGFVNDQDYRRDDPSPLLAVIGDSFIEAQQLPYAETMQGRLARALEGKMRVYSFAGSGAPLSQYLIWARHAVEGYAARAVVINVVINDFDESHIRYKTGPGFWLYMPDAEGRLRLRLVEHRPGWVIALARRSALARYLMINLKLHHYVFDINLLGQLIFGRPANAQPRYADNPAAQANPTRVRDSLAAIDAFFRDLPRLVALPADRVLFTLDGFRYPHLAAESAGSYFDVMRQAFGTRAMTAGYEVIDLDPLFFSRHRQTRERFDFPQDLHWNGNGHAVAAGAVLSSKLLTEMVPMEARSVE